MVVVLGNTGIEAGRISLGTVKFGRNTDVKYPGSFELPTDDEILKLLDCCRENGVNLLDTAPAYGSSEARVGQLLPGRREDWVLCTKVGEHYSNGSSIYDYSAQGVKDSIDQSLQRLRTDHVDILLIHSDGNDTDIISQTDAVETLLRVKEAGLARSIGMSTKTVEGTRAALEFSDVVMVTLNIDDQSHLEVIGEAENKGCGVLLKKVLASGHQTPQESLSFVLDSAKTASSVVGTINPDHLLANLELVEGFYPSR